MCMNVGGIYFCINLIVPHKFIFWSFLQHVIPTLLCLSRLCMCIVAWESEYFTGPVWGHLSRQSFTGSEWIDQDCPGSWVGRELSITGIGLVPPQATTFYLHVYLSDVRGKWVCAGCRHLGVAGYSTGTQVIVHFFIFQLKHKYMK